MMEVIVASWLVLEITDSPLKVTLVGASRLMPMLLLGLVTGSFADRFPKKQLMVVSQVINLGVASSMTLLIFADVVEPWHVYVAGFIMGTAWTVDFSARRAFYSELFDKGGLLNAVALDSATMTGSSMLGPLLGGILIFVGGFEAAYATMLGALIPGFVLLLSLKSTGKSTGMAPGTARLQRPTMRAATLLVDTLRVIRTNRTIWAVVMVTICVNFFGFPFMQMLPVIARDVLGVGSVGYGALAAATGIGSLTGTAIIATRGVQRAGAVFFLGAMVMLTGVFLFALSTLYALSFVLLIVAGVGMSGFGTMQSAIALQAVPPEMRGRAMGAVALGIGSAPLGLLVIGPLAEASSPQVALLISTGAGLVLLSILYWKLPVLRHSEA